MLYSKILTNIELDNNEQHDETAMEVDLEISSPSLDNILIIAQIEIISQMIKILLNNQ